MCLCMFVCSSESKKWCTQTWWVCVCGFLCVCFLWYSETVFKYWCAGLCVFDPERERKREGVCASWCTTPWHMCVSSRGAPTGQREPGAGAD